LLPDRNGAIVATVADALGLVTAIDAARGAFVAEYEAAHSEARENKLKRP
jgi:hypothetical protein